MAGERQRRREATARALAAGAVRYYLLKFWLTQIIAFDFDEALRITGDTGVYLQYAHARASRCVARADGRAGRGTAPAILPAEALALSAEAPPATVEEAGARLPRRPGRYAFDLARRSATSMSIPRRSSARTTRCAGASDAR